MLLAIDTCTHICAVGVYDSQSKKIVAEQSYDIGRGHAEYLPKVVEDVMGKVAIGYKAISKIGVTIGPGSFTGIRVGVAFARGLSFACDVRCVGVTTLEALSQTVDTKKPFAVTLHGGRGNIFCQIFNTHDQRDLKPFQASLVEAKTLLSKRVDTLIGDAAQDINVSDDFDVLSHLKTAPIAAIAKLAVISEHKPSPLYLRDADAKPQVASLMPRKKVSRSL